MVTVRPTPSYSVHRSVQVHTQGRLPSLQVQYFCPQTTIDFSICFSKAAWPELFAICNSNTPLSVGPLTRNGARDEHHQQAMHRRATADAQPRAGAARTPAAVFTSCGSIAESINP